VFDPHDAGVVGVLCRVGGGGGGRAEERRRKVTKAVIFSIQLCSLR